MVPILEKVGSYCSMLPRLIGQLQNSQSRETAEWHERRLFRRTEKTANVEAHEAGSPRRSSFKPSQEQNEEAEKYVEPIESRNS